MSNNTASASGMLEELRELLIKLNDAHEPVRVPIELHERHLAAGIVSWAAIGFGVLLFLVGMAKLVLFAGSIQLPTGLNTVAFVIHSINWISGVGFGLGLAAIGCVLRVLLHLCDYQSQKMRITAARNARY